MRPFLSRPSDPRARTVANTDGDSHLDLIRVPYCLYGVKYIGLVPLAPKAVASTDGGAHLGLIRVPYVLNGVKYTFCMVLNILT